MAARTVALGSATAVLLASQAGFLLVPLLIPLHVWAARHSGPAGSIGWGAAAGLGAGMVAWAAVYVAVGERQPSIWLAPLAVAVAVTAAVARA